MQFADIALKGVSIMLWYLRLDGTFKGATACPFCLDLGRTVGRVLPLEFGFQVICNGCGCRGPICETEVEAVEVWNSRGATRLEAMA